MIRVIWYIEEVFYSKSKSIIVFEIVKYLCKICDGKGYKSRDYWNKMSEETEEHCDSEMFEQGRVSECAQSLISCMGIVRLYNTVWLGVYVSLVC